MHILKALLQSALGITKFYIRKHVLQNKRVDHLAFHHVDVPGSIISYPLTNYVLEFYE